MVLYNIYFSAKGTTEICAKWIGTNLNMEMKAYNWCGSECTVPEEMTGEDVLLLSMPVYGGFIPQICADLAQKLKGDGTPAMIVAVYGNRHYDNALLQMKDILKNRGFQVIAAGAFLAEHSIFPSVGAGRPDGQDKKAMAEFAQKCREILDRGDFLKGQEIEVPGKTGYDAASFKGVPFKPGGDKSCTKCQKCVKACPRNAIAPDSPCKTDASRCISCGACIRACPTGARNYHGILYRTAEQQFQKKCAKYRKPETYFTGPA